MRKNKTEMDNVTYQFRFCPDSSLAVQSIFLPSNFAEATNVFGIVRYFLDKTN